LRVAFAPLERVIFLVGSNAWEFAGCDGGSVQGIPTLDMSSDFKQTELHPLDFSQASPTFPLLLPRRQLLHGAGVLLAAAGLAPLGMAQQAGQQSGGGSYVSLSQIHDVQTEEPEKAPGPFEPMDRRVGFAIVGLGRLSIDEILPAFGSSKLCKPVALVSGDSEKAGKIAEQYGIKRTSIYSYANYEQLAHNPEVKVIYIVLPNGMHEEYVVRGAKSGKHILCEKPMANSVAECERMIAACKAAIVLLMIAYRQQYEPNNRAIVKMVKEAKLGTVRSFIATNTQNQGDPTQWRLNRKLAGGGCLPDVGLYCLNAARFLTGEEPEEVFGYVVQPHDDPRFKEVEATCNFSLRFPSGLVAGCNSGYAGHHSQMLRLEGSDAWAELEPAFGYHGMKLRTSRFVDGREMVMEPTIADKDQFALDMDHFAACVTENRQPHTPGEEGLQDQRLMEAIYESAGSGRAIKVARPAGATRGPDPSDAS
jgi:predicted dehydrogenase